MSTDYTKVMAKETLTDALEKMEKGGEYGPYQVLMVGMDQREAKYLLELIREQEELKDKDAVYRKDTTKDTATR